MLYLILLNLSVLITLSILHIFWLFGGKTGLKYAFPHNSKHRKKIYKPNMFVLFSITTIIICMTVFCFAQLDIFVNIFSEQTIIWGNRITALLLLIRGIGNFKYLGLTKSFTDTDFAKLDTYVYSPLCILMALITLYINFTI